MITPFACTRLQVGLAAAALVAVVLAAVVGWTLGEPERPVPEPSPTQPWDGRLFDDDGGERP